MTTGDGLNHGAGIVIEQGGTTEDVQSGDTVDVQSGASETVEGTETVKTGGVVELDTGAQLKINNANVTPSIVALQSAVADNQKMVGINEAILETAGTWTKTRIAQGDYSLRHTAAANTSILGIDITEAIRTGASKGLQLASIDVIHKIGTAAILAHTATLQSVSYANNVANAI